jgi:integral membrane sensor domain MASE1
MMDRTYLYPARVAAVAAGYVVSGLAARTLEFQPGNIPSLWIPAGLSVALLVIWGTRAWPGVWLGSFAYNFWHFLDGGMIDSAAAIMMATGIGTGSTLAAVASATLVTLVRGDADELERPRDALAYVLLAGILGTSISATLGTAVLLLGDVISTLRAPEVWFCWYLGEAGAVVVIAPAIVLLHHLGAPTLPGIRRWLVGSAAVGLLLFLWFAFGTGLAQAATSVILLVPVGILLWSGLQLGRRVTSVAVILVAGAAIWGTINGRGPLVAESTNATLALLHSYIAMVTLTGLLLATMVHQARITLLRSRSITVSAIGSIQGPEERTRGLDEAIARRRREEGALADRVRALTDEARTLEHQMQMRVAERDAALAVLPDLFYVIDRDTQHFLMMSESFARRVAGLAREELIGRSIYEVLPPELALKLGEQHRSVFATGDLLHVQETLPLPEGPVAVDTIKAAFTGLNGEILGLVSSSRELKRG